MPKLLFLDDDRLILAGMTAQLAAKGYEVDAVDNIPEAITLVTSRQYDLALLDFRIGEGTGLEFAVNHVKKQNVPFIFLTAYGDTPTVDMCLSVGAYSFLTKPFEVQQLVPLIEAALARSADVSTLIDREEKLGKALEDTREISIAIGLVMERFGLSDQDAYKRLRDRARADRRKVKELATDLLRAANTIATLTAKPN
jgi:two-component system, response regulator PdtaR